MGKFILYLFETGFCLFLLYLAYWFFLRKETYFNFNRLFLVGSIILTLTVPLLHLNFSIQEEGSMERPAVRILQFRNYYQELVSMIDADFGEEPSSYDQVNPEFTDYRSLPVDEDKVERGRMAAGDRQRPSWPLTRILLFVYLTGVLYFLARFIYLVIRLISIARVNGISRHDGFRMVEMSDDISPFSFFRFLYINRAGLTEAELQNILIHEEAHIRQQHTIDHLLAHGLAVFQWFNPFAWQIRNALKTTHEYIADRKVLSQGFKPFDYQSLLLKQVIGYHSVELVNNFNLKPIKKRITMMTKIKSGIPAKLKAMLVIPFALIVFLLFADFTMKGPGNNMLDLNTTLVESWADKNLTGLWEKYKGHNVPISGEEYLNAIGLIYITEDKFSYLTGDRTEVREYFWQLENDQLVLSSQKGGPGTEMKIEFDGEDLTIWWTDIKYYTYRKTGADNTMDMGVSRMNIKMDLPVISNFRIMDRRLTKNLFITYQQDGDVGVMFEGKSLDLSELASAIESSGSERNKLDQPKMTTVFWIDKKIPMDEVVKVKEKLREAGLLKVAYAGHPHDIGGFVSPLLHSQVALPMLLPPMDAKIMDKEDVEKEGVNIFTIDLSARNSMPVDIHRDLTAFIETFKEDKYVFSLEYNQDIPYGQYIESVDMVFRVVYGFRDRLAMERYNSPYGKLGKDLQREIRKAFPMVLSEAWSGE